jgi:hypothetical protein
MRRALAIGAVLAALGLPGSASAKVLELGANVPRAPVSCPDNCQAVGRVTGYQSRAGQIEEPFLIPRAGKVVAFTVRLGKPSPKQVDYFKNLYPGTPQVQLSILRKGRRGKTKADHRLLAQSPTYPVDRFFGAAPTFAFDKPLKVSRGTIAAITVPTWAPLLAVGLGADTSWSSSRAKRPNCKNVTQSAAQTMLMSVKAFGCTYSTARLYYTVTYVPEPRATAPEKPTSPRPKPRRTR